MARYDEVRNYDDREAQDDRLTKQPVDDPIAELLAGPDPVVPPAASSPAAGPVNTRETRNALGGYAPVGTMLGFRTDGYGGDTKAANSMKNTFGRLASRYNADASGLEALFNDADFKRYFPNAQLGPEGGRGGMVDFGGSLSDFESGVPVGLVDVLNAFDGNTSQGWQWLDQVNTGGDAQAGGGGGLSGLQGMPGGSDILQALMMDGGAGDDTLLQQIQAELQRLMAGSGGTGQAPEL